MSCTSLSWTDAEGSRHHLGLLLVRETTRGDTVHVDRWTLGSDLRLDAADGGWTAGLGRRRYACARPRLVDGPELCEQYLRFLRGEERPAAPPTTRWRFLYFRERSSPASQWDRWWSLGLDLGWGRAPRGLVVPFGACSRIAPELFESDSVLALRAASNGSDAPELRCWTLRRPGPAGEDPEGPDPIR
ncbi:MAG TPA: hypothetical protein VF530_14055 [Planctomycetota bacterium]